LISQVSSECANPLPDATLAPGFCARIWASNLKAPRGIWVDTSGDLLVVDKGTQSVYAVWGDGAANRALLGSANGINHAVEVHLGYLYASSATTVFRWKYTSGSRMNLGSPEIVVANLPSGGHTSRSFRFYGNGTLFLQSGSGSNVDKDSSRSQIRSFTITNDLRSPLDWKNGEVVYDGLRNEVGLRFDKNGTMWGVENGVDQLNRHDIGGDIHQDNPAEEVNKFITKGFYGYPYCWSEYKLDPRYSRGPGSQWVHPDFMGRYTDQWCIENAIRPVFSMQAHMAPLDIIFYYGETFPEQYRGNAFVSFHGSWNRDEPVGYLVGRLSIDEVSNLPTSMDMFMFHKNGAVWPNKIRPVGLGFNKCQYGDCLYVSSDTTGEIIEISYQP